jgi:hypothetical protein
MHGVDSFFPTPICVTDLKPMENYAIDLRRFKPRWFINKLFLENRQEFFISAERHYSPCRAAFSRAGYRSAINREQ